MSTKNVPGADYSLASSEERRHVVEILNRNCAWMLKQGKLKNPKKLQTIVLDFTRRIASGGRFTGRDFEMLVRLFRKDINL